MLAPQPDPLHGSCPILLNAGIKFCWLPAPLFVACILILLQSAFSVLDLQYQVDICVVRCVPFSFAFTVWRLGAWALLGDWRLQVTLHFPSIWRKVSLGWFPLTTDLSGNSFQAHKFVISLNPAKYNLGKGRPKPMQSALSPFTVHDLRGGPLETSRAIVSCCIAHAVLRDDHCGSFAVHLCESLRILPPSPPSPGHFTQI